MADVANTLNGWSTTESSNLPLGTTTIGTGLDENLRMIQAVVRQTQDTGTIASATTTDLSTVNAKYITVSGVTTITGLGTLTAGMTKWLIFSGALTLTHNGTSLILPGAANITTVAGDTALVESLGSGNWKCLAYEPTTWTGTGAQVHAASPTLTGTLTAAIANFSGAVGLNAGAVIAASQALTGTVGSSTISGFLSVAATTGTFTNVGGTLSTATQNSVTTMTGLVTVGALNAGSITSGFGSIDVGADAISGGAITASQNLTVAGASNPAVLTIGTVGVSNGVVNAPASMMLNIDSTNISTAEIFRIATNASGASGGTELFKITEAGAVTIPGTLGVTNNIDLTEMTAPTGTANVARIFAVDNGSGKTVLKVIFGSGAAQVIATEP